MTSIDWAVFIAFILWVVWDGVRRSSASKDLEGYFAGNRSIPWWAAGLSVMATQASAITVIGTTGQGHETGLEFVQFYFGLPFALVLVSVFLIPLFRQAPILTAYEYLERRFGPETRAAASLVFLVGRCFAFGVVLYAPSVMLSEMLGVSVTWTVLTVGTLTTVYTVFGGVTAVIYTDVKQMLVILGGLVVCFGVVMWRVFGEAGVVESFELLGAAGKLEAVELVPDSTDLVPFAKSAEGDGASFWDDKYNLWSGLIGGLFLQLAYFGCDQSQVQRILTNPTANDSRRALLMSAVAKVPLQAAILLLGAMIWLFHVYEPPTLLYSAAHQQMAEAKAVEDPAFAARLEGIRARHAEAVDARLQAARSHLQHADGLAETESLRAFQRASALERSARAEVFDAFVDAGITEKRTDDTNRIFPQFILTHLPPVLLGLVIAAIFAAAMSSADSALNSLTAATVVDFYKRWLRPNATEREHLVAARILALMWGTFATLFALQVSGASSIIELVNKVGSYFYGTLLGTFGLAILVPRAGRWASFVGLLAGMATVLFVDATLRVQYLWYNVIGAVAVLFVGGLASIAMPRRAE